MIPHGEKRKPILLIHAPSSKLHERSSTIKHKWLVNNNVIATVELLFIF